MGSTRTLLTSQHLSTLPNLVSSFEHSEVLWDPLYMIRPRSVSAGSKCAASDLPDDLDVCRLSNRKHSDKTASRIDVGRTRGDSESSRGAAIPEEHVRQPGAAETWTPAETVKRGETVVQEASPGASVGVLARRSVNQFFLLQGGAAARDNELAQLRVRQLNDNQVGVDHELAIA